MAWLGLLSISANRSILLLFGITCILAAHKSGHHDGLYEGYFRCQQTDRITPEFQENRGKLIAETADALEAACNDPLPAYAELVDKVAEDDVDSLRQMLDVAEESREE
ncbi:hypothetical protein Hanom_Chr03g00197051 [Helianthus anomalus]